ncbi:Enterobacterial putative membrane protein (DUF943) [Tatumella ptyseos]|uniref:Enterobacterial putative membrane protein (DUF943) n=1 Tax=Tatumella ptyseos TaxID=82987 RepID=A0A2X5PWI4_9GAMM|nr:Enterobacterial putative membrane protein (DUF943) [Tatumella ptyseos]
MKKTLLIIVAAGTVLMSYLLWLTCRPVEIIAVHKKDNYSSVLVNNFPFTERGRINCWQENKQMLKNRYGVPGLTLMVFLLLSFGILVMGIKKKVNMTDSVSMI